MLQKENLLNNCSLDYATEKSPILPQFLIHFFKINSYIIKIVCVWGGGVQYLQLKH